MRAGPSVAVLAMQDCDRLPQAAAHTPHFLNRRHRHKVETQFYLLIYKYCCVYRHHICEYYYFQTFKHNT